MHWFLFLEGRFIFWVRSILLVQSLCVNAISLFSSKIRFSFFENAYHFVFNVKIEKNDTFVFTIFDDVSIHSPVIQCDHNFNQTIYYCWEESSSKISRNLGEADMNGDLLEII